MWDNSINDCVNKKWNGPRAPNTTIIICHRVVLETDFNNNDNNTIRAQKYH